MTSAASPVRIKHQLLRPRMAVDTTFLIEALDRPGTESGRANEALWKAILASGGMILIPAPALAEFVVKKEWIPPRDTPRVRVLALDERAALLINKVGDEALKAIVGDRNLVRMDALNIAVAKRWGASCFLCAETRKAHVPDLCKALEIDLVRPQELLMTEAEIAAEDAATAAEEAQREALRKQKEAEKEAAKASKKSSSTQTTLPLSAPDGRESKEPHVPEAPPQGAIIVEPASPEAKRASDVPGGDDSRGRAQEGDEQATATKPEEVEPPKPKFVPPNVINIKNIRRAEDPEGA